MTNPVLLQPAIEFGFDVLGALSPVLVTVATGYIIMFARKHGLLQDAKLQTVAQQQVYDALYRGIDFAENYGEAVAGKLGPIDAPDPRVAALANWLITQVPVALKRGGFNPNTPQGQAAIVQLAMAHLPPVPPPPPNSTAGAVSVTPTPGAQP